jgi:hypothetical protein
MITSYTEYTNLEESFINKLKQFIIDNYINDYLHLAVKNSQCFAICKKTKFPMTIPFIYINYNYDYFLTLDVCYYKKSYLFLKYTNENKNDIFKDLKDILDNFYEKFNLDTISNIRNYPIIKIDKYIEYLHKILPNKENYKDFINNVYKQPLYKKLKPLFDKEFSYLLNAKNFDLI